MTLTFDLLTLKVVSESRVTWATSVPILVFLGPMYVTDVRQTDVRRASSLNAPYPGVGGITLIIHDNWDKLTPEVVDDLHVSHFAGR